MFYTSTYFSFYFYLLSVLILVLFPFLFLFSSSDNIFILLPILLFSYLLSTNWGVELCSLCYFSYFCLSYFCLSFLTLLVYEFTLNFTLFLLRPFCWSTIYLCYLSNCYSSMDNYYYLILFIPRYYFASFFSFFSSFWVNVLTCLDIGYSKPTPSPFSSTSLKIAKHSIYLFPLFYSNTLFDNLLSYRIFLVIK